MRLVIISGLSGAGKSTAMRALEDLGYYCVDNLPLALLHALVVELERTPEKRYERVAVSIDARNDADQIRRFPEVVSRVRADGVRCDVVFLEAEDDVLLARFRETRRPHPLAAGESSVGEALARERALLAAVREHADVCLDTTSTHLYQLRDLVRQRVDAGPPGVMTVVIESFGYKHGVPPDADMVFDVRCLPNPYWEPGLRDLTGRDAAVRAYLEAQPPVAEMARQIADFLAGWIPAFESDARSYLTVAIGCTGGVHRSVYVAERLGERLRERHPRVLVRHRELV